MTDEIKAEVAGPGEPSRGILVDWVVDWIIATSPPDSTLVPRKDVEDLTGLLWDSDDLGFVLMAAKRKLYTTTRFEWRQTKDGLYMLSPAERKDELYRRERESLARHRAVLASSSTIPMDKLTTQEKAEVEHARRVALHLYEEGKKALRRRRLTSPPSEETKRIEG